MKTNRQNDTKRVILSAVLINVFVLIFFMLISNGLYESNDDNYLAAIIYGSYGVTTNNTVYINSILSSFLCFIHKIVPVIPIYYYFQIILIFFSFIVLTFRIMNKDNFFFSCMVTIAVLLFFGYECYVKMQYTKTAAITSLAGFCMLITYGENRINVFKAISGFALSVIGFLLRKESFLMIAVLLVPYCLFVFIHLYKSKKKIIILFNGILSIGLVCVISFLYYLDNTCYNTEEWKQYTDYNRVRTKLTDYGFPEYEKNILTYSSLDITQNDFYLYKTWNYADPEFANAEILTSLADLKHGKEVTLNLFEDYISSFVKACSSNSCVFILILSFCIFLFSHKKNGKRDIAVVLSTFLMFVIVELLLFIKGRAFLNRVDCIAYLTISFALIINSDFRELPFSNLHFFLISLMVLISFSQILLNDYHEFDDTDKEDCQGLYSVVSEDEEHIYFIEDNTQDVILTSAYGMKDIPPEGIFQNLYTLGGWFYPSPITQQILKKYDVQNPFFSLIDNDSAFLIADYNADLLIQHIRDHYNVWAYLVLVKRVNGHNIYRVVTHQPRINIQNANSLEIKDIEYRAFNKNGTAYIYGLVNLNPEIDYRSNYYIELKDIETGLSKWYYTTQYTYKTQNDSAESSFYFDCWFNGVQYGELNKYEIYFYAINGDDIYKTKIEISL